MVSPASASAAANTDVVWKNQDHRSYSHRHGFDFKFAVTSFIAAICFLITIYFPISLSAMPSRRQAHQGVFMGTKDNTGLGEQLTGLSIRKEDVKQPFALSPPSQVAENGIPATGGDAVVIPYQEEVPDISAVEAAPKLIADAYGDTSQVNKVRVYGDDSGTPPFWNISFTNMKSGKTHTATMILNDKGEYELGVPAHPPGKRPLYRSKEMATAVPIKRLYIPKTEEDVDFLRGLGLAATTSCTSTSLRASYWPIATSTEVTIIPTNDKAGELFAIEVTNILQLLGCTSIQWMNVAVLSLPKGAGIKIWGDANPNATAAHVNELPCIPPPKSTRAAEAGDAADTEDDKPLEMICAADIVQKPIAWMWDKRFAFGKISLIGGHPGTAKSILSICVGAIVTTGKDWPGASPPCEIGDVLFFSCEDGHDDTIAPRLEAAGADMKRCHIITSPTFTLETGIPRLEITIANHPTKFKLIVIDPISAYMGGADSHNEAEVRGLLKPLGDLAARHGIAVLGIMHLNKQGGNEALLRFTGSMAYVGVARSAYLVIKDPDQPERRLFLPVKNNIGNDRIGFAYRISTKILPSGIEACFATWENETVSKTANEILEQSMGPKKKSAVEVAKDFLSEALASGPVPEKEVEAKAKLACINMSSVDRAKRELGVLSVRVGGAWQWSLVQEHSALIQGDLSDKQGEQGMQGMQGQQGQDIQEATQEFQPKGTTLTLSQEMQVAAHEILLALQPLHANQQFTESSGSGEAIQGEQDKQGKQEIVVGELNSLEEGES
jgi:hypothetical protein